MADARRSGIRDTSHARVLIVDDDFDSAEVMSILLERAGFEVQVALKASSALLVVDEFIPNVAIIDIGLPEVSGYELVQALRAKPALRACLYIAVTGYSGEALSERSANAGFETHLTKPVSPMDLIQLLHEMVATAQSS
ncbi:MAG: response regulator [Myxococcales bacterium]